MIKVRPENPSLHHHEQYDARGLPGQSMVPQVNDRRVRIRMVPGISRNDVGDQDGIPLSRAACSSPCR